MRFNALASRVNAIDPYGISRCVKTNVRSSIFRILDRWDFGDNRITKPIGTLTIREGSVEVMDILMSTNKNIRCSF